MPKNRSASGTNAPSESAKRVRKLQKLRKLGSKLRRSAEIASVPQERSRNKNVLVKNELNGSAKSESVAQPNKGSRLNAKRLRRS
jgi:hypothetical protein